MSNTKPEYHVLLSLMLENEIILLFNPVLSFLLIDWFFNIFIRTKFSNTILALQWGLYFLNILLCC